MKTLFKITISKQDHHWTTLLFRYWTELSDIDGREIRCTGVTIIMYELDVTTKDMMTPDNVHKIWQGITKCHPDEAYRKDLGRRRAMRAAMKTTRKYLRTMIYQEAYPGNELTHRN